MKLLRVPEVAELTGYKDSPVRSKILKREWPYLKIGRAVRIKESFVADLIESSEVPARRGGETKAHRA